MDELGVASVTTNYPVGGWEVVYWHDHVPIREVFETVEEAWKALHDGFEYGELLPEGISFRDNTIVCFATFCSEPNDIRPDYLTLWCDWAVFEQHLNATLSRLLHNKSKKETHIM